MQEDLINIIKLAVRAPSGDNMQPWRFEIKGNSVDIFIVPERDQSLYNYRQQGSLLAHGALIENISLLAPVFGLSAEISLLPAGSGELSSTVKFSPGPKSEPSLYPYIKTRATNRTLYSDKNLAAAEKAYLLENPGDGMRLAIVDDASQRKILAREISRGDRMIFENKFVHSFLFSHIRWSQEEELQKKDGLFLKTMELKPPQVAVFKLVKNWKIMSLLNAIGFPKLAVKSNEQLYRHGCGFGAVIIPATEDKNYLQAGRALQLAWLKTNKLGMAFQPVSGVALLRRVIIEGEADKYLPGGQAELIAECFSKISAQFGLSEKEHIAFMFRFGFPKTGPSGWSSRQEPKIKIVS